MLSFSFSPQLAITGPHKTRTKMHTNTHMQQYNPGLMPINGEMSGRGIVMKTFSEIETPHTHTHKHTFVNLVKVPQQGE